MVIKNNIIGLVIIPLTNLDCMQKLKNRELYPKFQIDLLPGFNEVADDVWNEIKMKFQNIKEHVSQKKIIEIAAKTITKDMKVKKIKMQKNDKGIEIPVEKEVFEKRKVLDAKPFNILSLQEQEDIINDTWAIKTLQNWKKLNIEPAIRSMIEDQIKKIKNKS